MGLPHQQSLRTNVDRSKTNLRITKNTRHIFPDLSLKETFPKNSYQAARISGHGRT